jgi:predicted S18 family serine protease
MVLAADGILGNATPEFRSMVPAILATTRDFARAHWPHLASDADDFAYTLKIAKEDEPSSGPSAGLPIAVAFLSVMVGRAAPDGLSMSGALVCDSKGEVSIRRVGDAAHKVKGTCHRNLSGIVLPAENREDVEDGEVLPLSLARAMVRYAGSLTEAVEVLWGAEAWEW